ncbi:hypothetical protein E8E12_011461 [Didymella heteroderae]|uniref:J domain-containing protein n=1 Tax=Didymella heteroderae TaxID=1769908 RepID=A0A9P5C6M1_9PLEO|nr:hypothetical protein E8E12_011461 [Didymella heteroderae]
MASGHPHKTASSHGYENYDDRRRTQKTSRSAQPTSTTEYGRMFQNGTDKFASRTSGKILSHEEAVACVDALMDDLIAEGKNPQYARQKAEQFVIRKNGKRVAEMRKQGYRFKGDDEDEEDDTAARRNGRRGTGRKYRAAEYDGGDEDDDCGQRTRSGYASRWAESKETYDTSYPYADEELKLIRREIYEDWCDKGCDPAKAKWEAEKWYNDKIKNRRGGGKSARGSSFDSFSNMRDALDDEDINPRRQSRSSRNTRSGKMSRGSRGYRTEERCPTGWDGSRFDKYFTEEPDQDYRPRSKTGGSRGHRTEERCPGDRYTSGSYDSFEEPSGVRPAVDLYKLLGVSRKADVAEITKAWKKLCLKHHPDRVSGTAAKKTATGNMAQINEAKDILEDTDMRAYYERTGLIASLDRANKRLRRLSTEYEDSEDNNEWNNSRAPTATSTRPRRGTAGRNDAPSATIQRSSPEETRQSLSLTVKSSPNKLRQATGVPAVGKGTLSRNNIVSGKRARNSRVVREVDSDEDEDEDEDEADEVSAMDVDDDEEDDEVDAEGSEEDDMDAEGDEEDEDPIVVPTNKAIPVASKPKISVTKAQDTVEAKEMAMSDDDDELSDPDSDLEDMDDAEGEDEDAEGEDDDELGGAGDDMDMDSDEDMSRDQTPDISKLTRRQRAVLEQEEDGSLLALSNEAQKKKHLTAEEHAMRRAEMARRRKNLSEKRNEEEKLDTINRLLKKQPPKRGRKSTAADLDESGQEGEAEPERANPLFVRYIQNAKGTQLAVPDEWLQAPVGSMFAGKTEPARKTLWSGRMVEEIA